jgi:hypothetical protein
LLVGGHFLLLHIHNFWLLRIQNNGGAIKRRDLLWFWFCFNTYNLT